MYCTSIATVLFISLAFYVNGQNEMAVIGCISSNITLNFKPAIDRNRTVKSYTWNKDLGPSVDPSYAKYEPAGTPSFETFMDDIKDRIVHYQDEPTTLHLINLRGSDTAKYTLVVRYVTFTGSSPEFIITLTVEDVCLDEPKQAGKCSVTTCYAGGSGMLKTPMGEVVVNGHKLVKVCEESEAGNYTCCNNAGMCKSLKLEVFEGKTTPIDQGPGTTIVIVIVVVVIVVVGGAIGAILYMKKRRQNGSNQGQGTTGPTVVKMNKEKGDEEEKAPLE